MDNIDVVRAYFAALDSAEPQKAAAYLSDQYQLVDFLPRPMDQTAMLRFLQALRTGLPNLAHSLSNLQADNNTVKVTVQRSGTHSSDLDLQEWGAGFLPRTQKFIIFANATCEFVLQNGKIILERDVSPPSSNRRLPGMLKSLGMDQAY